jgi:hypothetical protein
LALAGAVPVVGVGALLVFTLPAGASNDLQIVSALVNEGAVPVEVGVAGAVFDQDTDGDGQSDWDEIQAGTDPTDRSSAFAIKEATRAADGSVTVSWSAVPGRVYRLQANAEPGAGDGAWLDVSPDMPASAATASQTDQAAAQWKTRIYRIRLVE